MEVPTRQEAAEATTGRTDDKRSAPAVSMVEHYEEVLYATLRNLWRRKFLVLSAAVLAGLAGIFALMVLPKTYTGEAYIQVAFSSTDANPGGGVTIDASSVVETRSRVIKSQQLARRVVDLVGLQRLDPEIGDGAISSWLQALVVGRAGMTDAYVRDRAASKLLRMLTVRTEPRAYLITIGVSASDPELAAEIANAFVVECLREAQLQRLSEQLARARGALAQQAGTFGKKHPNFISATAAVSDLEERLALQKKAAADEIIGLESVTLAEANAVPSAPNPTILIGGMVFLGLVLGSLAAIMFDGQMLRFGWDKMRLASLISLPRSTSP
ncbi:Wzz/FepE/Etk N-terminal domain-containing protein [Hyphomicrobium sp.]|uniref:Wzz/FepE/Etk N-terminal domain-containing protein n=1 Tax=Hyphomicrobium sp. TaxID=82 RepID=UPI003F6F389C